MCGPAVQEPPKGAWDWVSLVLRMPLDEVERHAGSDARALLEFIGLSIRILSKYSVFALLQLTTFLVASYYMYPDGLVDEDFGNASRGVLPRTNFGNLLLEDAEDHWIAFYSACWVSVVGMYVLTWLTIRELDASWLRVVDARQRQMASDRDPSTRAVLVHGSLNSQHSESVLSLWTSIYSDQVDCVRMVRDTRKLPALQKSAFDLGLRVVAQERSLTLLQGKPNSDMFKQQSEAALARRDAAIAVAEEKLEDTRKKHEAARAAAEAEYALVNVPENDVGLTYFVIFRTRAVANIALQVRLVVVR